MIAGTNRSTGGFDRITRLAPQVKMRIFGFATVVVCGSLLVAWITASLWNQLDRLQRDHGAIKSESFYLGVHLRGALRGLNDKLLQYGISQDPTFRDAFLNDSTELKDWLAASRMRLAETANLELLKSVDVSRQLQLLKEIESRYERYLTNAAPLFAAGNSIVSTRNFEATYKRVREISSHLFPLCDELVGSQRDGFGEFLRGTQETLISHKRLLMICSAMILGLAMVLTALVYRGMIAPLRFGLIQSKSIIERQEKLASLGILASGVAHEIRNPLTALKIRLFSLRKTLPAVAENEDATIIANEINRLERIVKDFLQFGRPSSPKLSKVPAGQILKEVQDLMKPQLEKSGISLKLENGDESLVHADVCQLKQVLINLIQNSAENIESNGIVALRLGRGIAELNGRARTVAILAVADTGKGIPPEVERRLFDPFFTTKDGGTGLGLAISARIVEKHGGLLRYATKLKHGTTFEVVVPQAE